MVFLYVSLVVVVHLVVAQTTSEELFADYALLLTPARVVLAAKLRIRYYSFRVVFVR